MSEKKDARTVMTPERALRMQKMRDAKAKKLLERKEEELKKKKQEMSMEEEPVVVEKKIIDRVKTPKPPLDDYEDDEEEEVVSKPKRIRSVPRRKNIDDDDLYQEIAELKAYIKDMNMEQKSKAKEEKWKKRREEMYEYIQSRMNEKKVVNTPAVIETSPPVEQPTTRQSSIIWSPYTPKGGIFL